MSKKYPKIIYVQKGENSDGSEYLNAYEYSDEADDGKVAVYTLKELKAKRTETYLD